MHKPETEWGVAKNEGRSHHLVHVCAKFWEILMFSERNPTSSTSSTPACKRAWYTSSRWSLQTCYTWSYSSRLKENAPLKITYTFISNAKITRGRLLHVSVLPQSHKDDSFKRKATQSNHWSLHQSGEVVWQREGSWPRSPFFLNDITGNVKRTEMITCSSSYFSQFGKTNITIHRNELQVVALTHQ